jgi:hypothetical protein
MLPFRRRTRFTSTPRIEVLAARTAAQYTCSHSGLLAAASTRRFCSSGVLVISDQDDAAQRDCDTCPSQFRFTWI